MYKFCLILFFILPTSHCALISAEHTTDTNDEEVKERLEAIEKRTTLPTNCLEATASTAKSGIYKLHLKKYSDEPFEVFCDEGRYENAGDGGWTVIQRRVDASVDFYRSWDDYKVGFGNLTGNYWMGLDKIYALTSSCEHELYIVLQRYHYTIRQHAKYEKFIIGDETQNYRLIELGDYEGTAGDSLKQHTGMAFSTKDRDNDISDINCAQKYTGAWWYSDCYYSNLNGDYKARGDKGITWNKIEKDLALKSAQMMVRLTKNCISHLKLSKKEKLFKQH